MTRVGAAVGATVSLLAITAMARPAAAADPDVPARPASVVDLDFTLLNFGAAFAGEVGEGFYVGVGASVLPALSYNQLHHYPLRMLEAHAFVRYSHARVVDVEVGPTVGYYEELKICIFGSCGSAPSGAMIGGYAEILAGWRHFKLGPRVEYAWVDGLDESGALFYPLMMRVELGP